MLAEVPPELIAAIKEGRAVLLLGAGASFGATDEAGETIPLGEKLAQELISNFLSIEYTGLDFRTAYDLSCSQRDVRTIQKYIHDRLDPFRPAPFHKLIPTFGWAGILTTNYDLVVERAYGDSQEFALQKLLPHVKDSDGAASNQDGRTVLYVKLHGCITKYNEINPPLVASTEQLIAFEAGRKGQFDIFLEWSRNKTIIFVGYAFGDANLRTLLNEIVKEGDNRPRHFIVDPFILPAFSDYWRERRFMCLRMGFADFLQSIDRAIPPIARGLTPLNLALKGQTSFSKFMTVSARRESDELAQYLSFDIDHVCDSFEPVFKDDIKKFYRGFDLGWLPFQLELDIERKISDAIISDHVITVTGGSLQKLVILKGHAGSGKSVSLRRACWDSGKIYEKLCFFVAKDVIIKTDIFVEIFSLTNLPIFLFVDGVSVNKKRIVELISFAKTQKACLTIVATESFNTWNTSCAEVESYVNAEYEMRALSGDEIDRLIIKLEENDSLGTLKGLPREQRRAQFEVAYARQILVALLETTHGLPLVEIILNEYKSIGDTLARQIYLDICSLNRFGQPVRAGLIARIHNITFEEFEEKFFRPLEQIVRLRPDKKSGDYVYEARHPHIAEALYDAVLRGQEERFDNLLRVISKLNPSYSYDVEVLARIIRADVIESTISDVNRARQIYEVATESMGESNLILHQRGLYEMRISGNLGELRKAGDLLSKAAQREPRNKSLRHSLAELDLKRARLSQDLLERSTWRRAAVERASELTLGDSSPYPYHTILKANIDDIADNLAAVEEDENDASTRQLGESILRAEETLKRGLQRFPDDQSLLGGEGRLAEVLSNSNRAEGAFRKAFAANPRSSLIARRLVKILRAKGETKDCVGVLAKALEANPSSVELHYELARVLLTTSPDADQRNPDTILYHLRRSFSTGDRNYRAQFWYARQLSVMDKFEEARPIFETLGEMHMSFAQKQQPRDAICDEQGVVKRYDGEVTVFRSSYGFIRSNFPRMDLFVPLRELDADAATSFVEGSKVSFEIAFNLKGPVALNVRRTS